MQNFNRTAKPVALALAGALTLLITGCSSTYSPSSQFTQLESRYQTVTSDEQLKQHAPVAFEEANDAIAKLERMEKDGADQEALDHQRYLAKRKLETAIKLAEHNRSQDFIADAELRRKDMLLQARERQLTQAELDAAYQASRAEAAEKRAAMAEERAKSMAKKAEEMASKLESVTTKTDERGLVITMGDILFAFDKAKVKPGASRTLEKVSDLLAQYPERKIQVEGFTDSTGAEAYNQALSEQRAMAVKRELVDNGLDASRLTAKGYGESYPVATNDTAVGRQQNRRVELVVAKAETVAPDRRVSMQ